MSTLRFVPSQWNRVVADKTPVPVFLFGLAMIHLKDVAGRPLVKCSGRARIACWGCETIIEKGESYRATSGDRADKLGVHDSCLSQVQKWARRQEKKLQRKARGIA